MSVYERLRSRWLEDGIHFNEGVSEAMIYQFERRHNISLPKGIKQYLLTTNGMSEGEVDENLVSFLSLESMDHEPNHKAISANEIEITIADFSLMSHLYVLRTTPKGDRSPVFATDREHEKQIAATFEEFLNQYLSSPRTVAHCWT
jgi:hypothetical protein